MHLQQPLCDYIGLFSPNSCSGTAIGVGTASRAQRTTAKIKALTPMTSRCGIVLVKLLLSTFIYLRTEPANTSTTSNGATSTEYLHVFLFPFHPFIVLSNADCQTRSRYVQSGALQGP